MSNYMSILGAVGIAGIAVAITVVLLASSAVRVDAVVAVVLRSWVDGRIRVITVHVRGVAIPVAVHGIHTVAVGVEAVLVHRVWRFGIDGSVFGGAVKHA